MKPRNLKMGRRRRDGYFDIRVSRQARNGKRDPRLLLRCGCCPGKLEIYYGGDSLEINGVMGSVGNWKEVLLPLLSSRRMR